MIPAKAVWKRQCIRFLTIFRVYGCEEARLCCEESSAGRKEEDLQQIPEIRNQNPDEEGTLLGIITGVNFFRTHG
ncbi:hypothetical protein ACFX13_030666 [Malus domestica]|uniref:uncharacterized protein isoform X3 n=1 Tax=Malus domestica TaxID=3750 RepID=UPI0014606831